MRRSGSTDDFVDLGADSLHFEELLSEIEDAFGRALPASMFLDEPTPERISNLLRSDGGRDATTPSRSSYRSSRTDPGRRCSA